MKERDFTLNQILEYSENIIRWKEFLKNPKSKVYHCFIKKVIRDDEKLIDDLFLELEEEH